MTESFKPSADILALAWELIAHFEDESSRSEADRLSRWMAHYIAEKIKAVEANPADSTAQKECAEAIVHLWEHRAVYPHNKRLTEQFEAILSTLERLDPEATNPFYLGENEHLAGDAGLWLKIALHLDRAARILITYCLKLAAIRSGKGKDWSTLARAAGLGEQPDLVINRRFLEYQTGELVSDAEVERRRLRNLSDELTWFLKTARLFDKQLKDDIARVPEGKLSDAPKAKRRSKPSGKSA